MTRNFGRTTPGESGLVMQNAQDVARKVQEDYYGLHWGDPDDRVRVIYPATQEAKLEETEKQGETR